VVRKLKNSKYFDLKVLMFAKRVSQKKLAEILNITEQSLNSKLNCRRDFSIGEAEKIIEYLEIENPSDIFFKSKLHGA